MTVKKVLSSGVTKGIAGALAVAVVAGTATAAFAVSADSSSAKSPYLAALETDAARIRSVDINDDAAVLAVTQSAKTSILEAERHLAEVIGPLQAYEEWAALCADPAMRADLMASARCPGSSSASGATGAVGGASGRPDKGALADPIAAACDARRSGFRHSKIQANGGGWDAFVADVQRFRRRANEIGNAAVGAYAGALREIADAANAVADATEGVGDAVQTAGSGNPAAETAGKLIDLGGNLVKVGAHSAEAKAAELEALHELALDASGAIVDWLGTTTSTAGGESPTVGPDGQRAPDGSAFLDILCQDRKSLLEEGEDMITQGEREDSDCDDPVVNPAADSRTNTVAEPTRGGVQGVTFEAPDCTTENERQDPREILASAGKGETAGLCQNGLNDAARRCDTTLPHDDDRGVSPEVIVDDLGYEYCDPRVCQ